MKILLRVILSPFVFCYGLFMVAAGMLFPLTMVVLFAISGLLFNPFVKLLKLSGASIEYIEPFMIDPEWESKIGTFWSVMIGSFLGATVPLWGAFYVTGLYIGTGEIFTGE